jgi:hypothetical protein
MGVLISEVRVSGNIVCNSLHGVKQEQAFKLRRCSSIGVLVTFRSLSGNSQFCMKKQS